MAGLKVNITVHNIGGEIGRDWEMVVTDSGDIRELVDFGAVLDPESGPQYLAEVNITVEKVIID